MSRYVEGEAGEDDRGGSQDLPISIDDSGDDSGESEAQESEASSQGRPSAADAIPSHRLGDESNISQSSGGEEAARPVARRGARGGRGRNRPNVSRGRKRQRANRRDQAASAVQGDAAREPGADSSSQDSSQSSSAERPRPAGRRPAKKKFRLQGKHIGLTFPQCELTMEEFIEGFARAHGHAAIRVAEEKHADGATHFHVYLRYDLRKDIRSARFYDFKCKRSVCASCKGDAEHQSHHPSIERLRDFRDWVKYISKDGVTRDFTEEFDPMLYEAGKRKRMYDDNQWTRHFIAHRQRREVSYPIRLVTAGRTYEMQRPDPSKKKRHWWIVSPPNAGKTRWLNKTFRGQRVYVPSADDYPFEGYDGEDIIVYDDRDDTTFAEFSNVANTWEIECAVFGKVRYRKQYWPIGATRNIIVLSNKSIEEHFKSEDWDRIKKRFIEIKNPTLLEEGEMSSDDEDMIEALEQAEIARDAPAAAAAPAAASSASSDFITLD